MTCSTIQPMTNDDAMIAEANRVAPASASANDARC